MRAAQLSTLLAEPPAGVAQAVELVADFDAVLVSGLSRLGPDQAAAVEALAGAVAGTPLAAVVAEAAAKVGTGSVDDTQLAALAGARAALLGAVHDALLGQLDTALGRERAALAGAEPAGAADDGGGGAPAGAVPAVDNLLAGCRSWLLELALTGWRGVDHDLVASSGQVLSAVLAEPTLRRLAVLLDGLVAELRACCPVATMDRLPVRRWADLWARAVLLAQPGAVAAAGGSTVGVSGRLLPLGVDVHEHATAVQFQLHGLFEPAGGGTPRLVRTALTAMKVDTIVGPAVWRLVADHPVLLGALAGGRAVEVADVPLLGSGDLYWDESRAVAGEPVDPFATARVLLGAALAPAVPALDRHPVRIAEPVLLAGYTVADDGSGPAIELDGRRLPVDVDRLPACGPLTPRDVMASTACIGLLRYDGGWSVQPLAVQAAVKRKAVTVGTGDWALGPTDPKVAKAQARAGDSVAVLRERAGRLLRP